MIIYKIMNKEGLFSTGGMRIGFHKKGKEWKERRHLITHLTQTIRCGEESDYENCDVVEFELKEVDRYDIGPLLQKKKQELVAQDELEEKRKQKRIEARERKRFIELSKKFMGNSSVGRASGR